MDKTIAERIKLWIGNARYRLGMFILGGRDLQGRRGVFIGEEGAIITWPDGVSGVHIFGADVGLEFREGGPPRTVFAPRGHLLNNTGEDR
ncbi:hypothetical protein [Pelagerythrobacter marinus]|uniref:hypothetical protein n=1 Tax=Pelagerythrobacter marinus TaxID=538382 RepID=UPI002AC943C2|nr:hypothetical protein [Pelagerythrobacter marinus]WPZ05529.1 hypothetical protein T8T98_08795 [Pelagerythrobacter marinus]